MSEHSTYMTKAIGPLPFCPGCGHTTIIKALDKALVKLQPDPAKVVIVTDIGCIGLSDRYFTTSAFHGLHGRSITYACGLKLARPELTVVALKGDGGCGIGGTHLLNVARRNIGITLIVANNFNYGMTGGQHSVTTPSDATTSTTPWGNVERPMDLAATAAAAGAAWVNRTTSFDGQLSDIIATAIQQPGFAMLDIWELCMAYYAPRNKLRKSGLTAMLDEYGFELGQIADRPRPEYSERYRAVFQQRRTEERARPAIEVEFGNAVPRQTGIIIAGSAGQKIKSTASLFARAAMASGLHATQKDDYPITVMTGHSVAELIISPERIDYTGIDSPDFFILLSEDGLNRTRKQVEKLPETCVLYAEETIRLPKTRARVRRYPFIAAARKVSKLSLASLALATMIEEKGFFPLDAMSWAISSFQKPKVAETNLKAVAAGSALAQGHQPEHQPERDQS